MLKSDTKCVVELTLHYFLISVMIQHTINPGKTLTGFILGDPAPPGDDTDLPPPPPPDSEDSMEV